MPWKQWAWRLASIFDQSVCPALAASCRKELPYSGKISRVAIFADEGLRSFSRFYFRGSRGLARIRTYTHAHAYAQCLMYGKGRCSLFFEVTNFAVWRRSAKTAKINTLENFPLYGIINDPGRPSEFLAQLGDVGGKNIMDVALSGDLVRTTAV